MNWKLLALIVGAVLLVVAALYVAGANPGEAVVAMLKGSLGSSAAITGTLREMTPMLFAGLAVFLALRAGLFNIGVEGQLVVGALTCAVLALRFPGFPGVLVGMLGGMVAGALWALPAGLIKAYRNGHEVITTIMLNSVAGLLTAYLVDGPFKAPKAASPTTSLLPESTHLGNVIQQPVTMNWAIVLGVLLAVAMAWWLRRTVAGYELRSVGANATAARFAGVDARAVIVKAMLGSGAVAGLAGAMQVLCYEFRFYQDFSPGYGFDALGVALLSGGSALGVIPASFVFGMLNKGAISLAIVGVPKGIVGVILGLLILIAAAIRYRRVKTVA